MEALISRMIALGPLANRPPHIALESAMRRLVPVFLLLAASGGCNKQEPAPPQPVPTGGAAVVTEKPVDVITASVGKPAPKSPVTDLATGKPVTLADFKGKPVLLNLWATWCAPCVRELPTLARLAQAQGGRLAVLTVSEDLEGARVVKPFLAKRGLAGVHPYHDPNNGLMLALKAVSLPLTILYDADGHEVWRVANDIDWSGPQARALLAQAGV
jgi:thiol-disulfide isomerase/thioredoxin